MKSSTVSRMMLAAAMGAALAIPSPALAKKKAPPPPPPPTPVYVPSTPVDRFYAARKDAMLWMASREAQVALIELLRDSPVDGFTRGPQLAADLEAKIVAAQTGDAAAAKAADRALSQALIDYVQWLYQPVPGMIYGDNWVRPRAPTGESILATAARAPSLEGHVRTVWNLNPIYAQLRQAALAERKVANGGQSARLALNMTRARFKSPSSRYVLVDVASQRLWMYENDVPVDTMKVVVGKNEVDAKSGKSLQTPMIASVMYYTVFNPYWHVPDHLVRKAIAPNVVKQGMTYLKTRKYEVVDAWRNDPAIIDPTTIDWKAVADGTIHAKVRQQPTGENSMGKMKFPFENGEGIYLHDTPLKEYFKKTSRDLSNGCVRLEDAVRFQRWLNQGPTAAEHSSNEQAVAFPQGVPVYMTYLTALPDQGKIAYAKDIYGWDRAAPQIAATAPAAVGSGITSAQ